MCNETNETKTDEERMEELRRWFEANADCV
jgi:hypothetical protein